VRAGVSFGAMTAEGIHSIRIVVQRVRGVPIQGYRLLAYPSPEGMTLRPVDFPFKDQLLERFRAAISDFHPELLREDREGDVIFAAEMQLSSAQLSILGLLR